MNLKLNVSAGKHSKEFAGKFFAGPLGAKRRCVQVYGTDPARRKLGMRCDSSSPRNDHFGASSIILDSQSAFLKKKKGLITRQFPCK